MTNFIFPDQLLMTDDSNIVRKENLKLSPRDSIIVNLNIESNDPGFDGIRISTFIIVTLR